MVIVRVIFRNCNLEGNKYLDAGSPAHVVIDGVLRWIPDQETSHGIFDFDTSAGIDLSVITQNNNISG